VDVEKRDDVAFMERVAFDVSERAAKLRDRSDRDVPGNERVRDARQLAVMEVDVGPADLGEQHVEQRGAGIECRPGELDDADGLVRCRDCGGENARRSGHDLSRR
jgi:hypothetical protein